MTSEERAALVERMRHSVPLWDDAADLIEADGKRIEALEAERDRFRMKADAYREQLEDGFAALIDAQNKGKTVARERIEALEALLDRTYRAWARNEWKEGDERLSDVLFAVAWEIYGRDGAPFTLPTSKR